MKTRKFITTLFISLISLCSVAFGVSLAWLADATTELNIENLDGGVISQYFHDGDGSEENPFTITRPVHLYNMTELYKAEGLDFANQNYHFQLGDILPEDTSGQLRVYEYDDDGVIVENSFVSSLNMNYYEDFSPIGDEDHSFKQTFDGSHLTIENLHISGSGISDIGFFGYVESTAEIKDLYLDNFDIDITGAVADNHSDHISNAYVGYLAGHIDDATCFENTYVNHCEIKGQSCKIDNDWGYFGYCENATTLEKFVKKAKGEGDDNDWGGSINSKDYTALGYSIHPTNSGTHTKTVSGEGGYVMAISASTANNPENNNVVYRLRDGSYVPLKFNSEGKAATTNTGYLVGSNVGTGVNASPKIASYRLNNIGNALSNTAYTNMQTTYTNTNNITYDDSKLEILTYNSGGWKRIKDTHNENNNSTNTQIRNYTRTSVADLGLQRYEDARNSLQNILTGSQYVHGIHFDNNQVSSTNKLTIPANVARVDGTTYTTTYEAPKGSINFKLKKKGYITFFAGTYNSSNVNLNFFSLNHVTRNGGNIANIKQITEIFLNTAAEGDPYVYKYSDNTYSAGTRGTSIFNLSTILSGNAPVVNMLYYFELPVNAGEYAMGVSGSTQGAYMMYLDLGANAGSTETKVDEFLGIDYRSAQEIVTTSILLITYEQLSTQNVSILVEYVGGNRYNITYNEGLTEVLVTLLDETYIVYVNGTALPQAIQTNTV